VTWEQGLHLCASLAVTWFAARFAYRFARYMHGRR
jgi:hypothetical protein